MDRNELQNILKNERNSQQLTSLHPGFYRSVKEYIHDIEDEINKINNIKSLESKMLTDELNHVTDNIEGIFSQRVKKITHRATLNALSIKSPIKAKEMLLPEEYGVYESILSAIQVARNQLLEPILDPSSSATSVKGKEAEGQRTNQPDVTGPENIVPDAQEASTPPTITNDRNEDEPEIPKRNINEEYFVVRILKDLPTFNAVDNRNYTTKAEDVVVLPAMNANVLVKRGAAHLITKINDSN